MDGAYALGIDLGTTYTAAAISREGRAEIVSLVADEAFYSLDAPLVRITTPHIPLPAAAALEDLAMPSVERIADTVLRRLEAAR